MSMNPEILRSTLEKPTSALIPDFASLTPFRHRGLLFSNPADKKDEQQKAGRATTTGNGSGGHGRKSSTIWNEKKENTHGSEFGNRPRKQRESPLSMLHQSTKKSGDFSIPGGENIWTSHAYQVHVMILWIMSLNDSAAISLYIFASSSVLKKKRKFGNFPGDPLPTFLKAAKNPRLPCVRRPSCPQ